MSRSEKSSLRERLRRERELLRPEAADAASSAICQALLSMKEMENPGVVAGYLARGREVNIDPLLNTLLHREVAVLLPRVALGRRLDWCRVADIHRDCKPGAFGIREPTTPASDLVNTVRLILTPGIAFDHTGRRLGAGKGYYDSFFRELMGSRDAANSPLRVGIAYDFQMVEYVPSDIWDERVDWIVTENGATRCHPDADR